MEYDHIVVGAGSAGAIIASRLSEDPSRSVLLLEAGPDYPNLEEMPEEIKYGLGRAPDLWTRAFGPDSKHNWNFVARPTGTARTMEVPRGKIVGGSSAINAMLWLRGVPEDYNGWAASGNDRWSFDELLPYLNKVEDSEFADDYRGQGGPIKVRQFKPDQWNVDQAAFYQACRAAGYPGCPDHNRPDSSGVGPVASNCFEGMRWSAAIGYINPARHRPNLTVRPNCLAHRVLFEGQRARGVLVESGGELFSVLGHETILCAGAIGSPHILLLSGVGPPEQLHAFDVDLVNDLPGVGKNLRDHPEVTVLWRTRPEFEQDPLAPKAQVILRYTASGSELRNDVGLYYGSVIPMESAGAVGEQEMYGVKITVVLNLALGSGTLSLESKVPDRQPSLNYRYLESEADRQRLREAVRISAALGDQAAFQRFIEARVSPSDEVLASDQALDQWMRDTVVTSHHSSGTCKMGPATDPTAVVDQYGRVHGIGGLRVADASIMPDCVRGNTNATVMAIGEMIADLIKEGL